MPLSDFQIAKKRFDFLTWGGGRLILRERRLAHGAELRFDCLHASAMKPAAFKYKAATCLEHALSLKAEHGDDAKFLAGGQSLIPAMNFRLARPSVLIDINGLKDLAGVDQASGEEIRVGALTRYRDLERNHGFLNSCPLFADALPHIAHPQIRNRGTIGGNLSHADPASELPALTVAMEGRIRLKSSAGEREVAASAF